MSRKYLDICRILTGSVARDDNGVIYPSEKSKRPRINLDYVGRYNGAFSARYFGLSVRSQKFEMKGSQKAVADHCYKQISMMGTSVRVAEPKDAECVLIWRYMLNPVILAMQVKGKEVVLTAFTARTVLGQLACFRMMNVFYKHLSDLLEIKDGGSERDRDARPTREERKAAKAEKQKEQKDRKEKQPDQKPEEKKPRHAAKKETAEKAGSTTGAPETKAADNTINIEDLREAEKIRQTKKSGEEETAEEQKATEEQVTPVKAKHSRSGHKGKHSK